jgi:hypothetical protein
MIMTSNQLKSNHLAFPLWRESISVLDTQDGQRIVSGEGRHETSRHRTRCCAVLRNPWRFPRPRSTGAPQQNNGQNTSPADNTAQRQQTSATTPNQTIPIYAQSGSAEANRETKNSQDATDVERQLTKFTGYLVGVGLLQFFILAVQAALFFQQKKIMEQHRTSLEQLASSAGDNARAIETQAGIMKGQLSSMDGQLAAMQHQNSTLEESVAVARDAAKSTQASVEAGIEKERARLKIVVESITPNISLARAICSLENYGLTPAFISDFRARFLYCLPKDIQPDYSMCNQILYAESLQPGARTPKSFLVSLSKNSLNEDEVMKIKKEKCLSTFTGSSPTEMFSSVIGELPSTCVGQCAGVV